MDERLKELLQEGELSFIEKKVNRFKFNQAKKKLFFDDYKPDFYFENNSEPVRVYIPRQNGYSTTKEITKEMLENIKNPMENLLDKQNEFINHHLENAFVLGKDISITKKYPDRDDGIVSIVCSVEYIERLDHRDFPKAFFDDQFGGRE